MARGGEEWIELYIASHSEKKTIQQVNGGALGFDARVGFGEITTRRRDWREGEYACSRWWDLKRVVRRSTRNDL